MRTLSFGSVLLAAALSPLGLAVGCGDSTSDPGKDAAAGSATAGSTTNGAGTTGHAGSNASAGSSSGGNASGGATAGGSNGGATTGGQSEAQGGVDNAGGNDSGLVDCDPKKVLCKRAAPDCADGEVPSVEDNCYGDCVKVAQCACSAADQCPDANQYTCWAQQHCGPFVR